MSLSSVHSVNGCSSLGSLSRSVKRSAEDEQRGSTRRQGAAAELTARRDPPGLMMPKYQSWRPPFLDGTKVRMSDWP